jgi:D-alanine-D-alanine ligase
LPPGNRTAIGIGKGFPKRFGLGEASYRHFAQEGAIMPLRITVLMGGPSAEREVSLNSGRAIAGALESLGHRVTRADVGPDDLSALDEPADMVFIALHGTWGEDGKLQAILERRGIPYCGCGPQASAMAMDKVLTKRRFIEVGVPTPPFEHVTAANAARVIDGFELPAVAKPVAEGSSVGCTIVRERGELKAATERLLAQYGEVLVERYIRGTELTVGVLGDRVLPPCQIVPKSEFYDYKAKYLADDTEYLFEIDLPAAVLEQVQRLTLKAFDAVGCRHFSRIDWIVESGTNQPFCLEINTIPGFTDHSLLPKAAARVGIGFADLCQRIVELTMEGQKAEGKRQKAEGERMKDE